MYHSPGKIGIGILEVSVKRANLSSVTGVVIGASFSFQSGMSSSNALVSRQAPDNVCWPEIFKMKKNCVR